MGKLYYKNEFVDRLKMYLADGVRMELNGFATDTSEIASIAVRNRIAGMIDLVDLVEQKISEEEEE